MYVRSVTVAEHTKLMTSRDEIKKKVAEYNDVGFGKRLAPPKKAICIEQNDEYSSLQVMRIMGKSRLSHFQVDFFLKLIAICDENGECYAKNTHQFWLENADRLCRAQTTLNHCLTILQNENWIKVETCLGVLVITINPILLSNPYNSSILSHFEKHEVTVGCYTLFCSIAHLVEADGHYRSRTLFNDCCFKELNIGKNTNAFY
ncbi:Resolvase homolog yefC, partial [Moritella viscosa]